MNLATAIAIAAKGFEKKNDKGGSPYILHCLRVMNNVDGNDRKIIAVLHDIVEDGVLTLEALYDCGFTYNIIIAIELLTHEKRIPYDDYIKKVALNEDARIVKLADLKDNSDITRLKGLTKKDFDRMEKYHKAYIYLSKV